MDKNVQIVQSQTDDSPMQVEPEIDPDEFNDAITQLDQMTNELLSKKDEGNTSQNDEVKDPEERADKEDPQETKEGQVPESTEAQVEEADKETSSQEEVVEDSSKAPTGEDNTAKPDNLDNSVIRNLRNVNKEHNRTIQELKSRIKELETVKSNSEPEWPIERVLNTIAKAEQGDDVGVPMEALISELEKHPPDSLTKALRSAAVGAFGEDSGNITDVINKYGSLVTNAHSVREKGLTELNELKGQEGAFEKQRAASWTKVAEAIPDLNVENPTSENDKLFLEAAAKMKDSLGNHLMEIANAPELILTMMNSMKFQKQSSDLSKENKALKGQNTTLTNPQSNNLNSSQTSTTKKQKSPMDVLLEEAEPFLEEM